MCNQSKRPHVNLDDDLSDLLGEDSTSHANIPAQSGSHVPTAHTGSLADSLLDGNVTHETRHAAAGHRYEEKCPDCRGSSVFRSYTGRVVGNCFKCKGKVP